jgi:hypothetical protein
MSNLDPGERVEADDGYVGKTPRHVKCPMSFNNPLKTVGCKALFDQGMTQSTSASSSGDVSSNGSIMVTSSMLVF